MRIERQTAVRESPAFDPNKNVSDADIVRAVYAVPLRFAPVSNYEYANTGYWTLAEIIRIVTGRPWSEFISQRIFTPAGMRMTAPTNAAPTLPNRAVGYTGNDNGKITTWAIRACWSGCRASRRTRCATHSRRPPVHQREHHLRSPLPPTGSQDGAHEEAPVTSTSTPAGLTIRLP